MLLLLAVLILDCNRRHDGLCKADRDVRELLDPSEWKRTAGKLEDIVVAGGVLSAATVRQEERRSPVKGFAGGRPGRGWNGRKKNGGGRVCCEPVAIKKK